MEVHAIENEIKNIVIEEFSKVVKNIEGDFENNYIKKRYNFLLSQLDENIIANMVFVSSFESKCGFAIETCAKKISRIRYGENNVPTIVNPNNIEHHIDEKHIQGQIIVSNIDLSNGDLNGEISSFRANNMASGAGKKRKESNVNQESIKELTEKAKKYKTNTIHTKPVDLAFFDGEDWVVMELKAGGDLDSSNAPSNVEKLLTIYSGLQVKNAKAYFVALYNKDGEGNTWKGAVKKHLAYPEMFLIGKTFWDKILPEGISYDKFTQIYKSALEEIDVNKHIRKMIEKAIK